MSDFLEDSWCECFNKLKVLLVFIFIGGNEWILWMFINLVSVIVKCFLKSG